MTSPRPCEVLVSVFEDFFRELDASWKWPADAKTSLRIIGSAALMLQADYERGTKDTDVLKTRDLSQETKQQLLELAGRGTEIHKRHRVYIDVVSGALPFLPQQPAWTQLPELSAELRHFDLSVLSVIDVVVSKLKRFSPNDIGDIEAMMELGLVPHDALVERFKLAVDIFAYDARAEELPKYIANLNRVERDMFAVPESEIDFPNWV